MTSIEGLAAEHCDALEGAEIGDLILVESYPKRTEREQSDVGSDDESEGSQVDGDEPSLSGEEEAAEAQLSSNEHDQESEDDVETSELEEDISSNDGEIDRTETATATLYLIQDLSRNDEGEVKTITLREVTHCLKPAEATNSSFHIYGDDIVLAATSASSGTIIKGVQGHSIEDILGQDERIEHSIQLKPTGDDVREILYGGRCPAQCSNGWMSTQEEMHALVAEPIRDLLLPYAPTCPVCIGKSKTQEHQTLREMLEDNPPVDIGAVVDFLGPLNVRRKALGYSFKQYDEREWGMMFDDMLSEDEDEDGPTGDYYEHYPEALDPNSNPTYHAASHAAIAALPQKSFGAVANGEDSATCAVCITKFTDDAVVAELPCGHYFDVECAQRWLKMSNACPSCRKKLPAVEDTPIEAEDGAESESVEIRKDEYNENKSDVEADADTMTDEIEMDGDDVVMSDVEDAAVTA